MPQRSWRRMIRRLLKAVGRIQPLLIAASRTVNLGGTVATVGQKANAE